MEPTTNTTREQIHSTPGSQGAAPANSGSIGTNVNAARPTDAGIHAGERETPNRQESARTRAGNGGTAEVVGQAKQAINDAYDKTSRTVQKSYKQAVDYGRDNPMKTMLMVFGAGVGAGILIASTTKSSAPRDRMSRIVPSVANALADVVSEIFH